MKQAVDAAHPDHRAGEFPVLAGLIREARKVKGRPDRGERRLVVSPQKLPVAAVELQGKDERLFIVDRDALGKGRPLSVFQREDADRRAAQARAAVFPQEETVHVIIVEDEARAVLVDLGLKLHPRRDHRAERLEFSRQQAELIEGSLGLFAAHTEPARAGSKVRKCPRQLPRRIVEVSERRPVKIICLRDLWQRAGGELRRQDIRLRQNAAGGEPEPAVRGPLHPLDRGLAAEGAAVTLPEIGAAGVDRAGAQMDHVGLSRRQIREAAVPGLLERRLRIIIFRLQVVRVITLIGGRRHGGEHDPVRVGFVGAEDIFRARDRHTVVVARPALGAHEVIVTVLLIEVRRLDAAAVRPAGIDALRIADDLPLLRIIFRDADRAGLLVADAGLPFQRDDVFSSVVIVEQGGVEPRRVQIHRLRPGTPDVFCGDQVIFNVKIARVHRAHHAVDDVKEIFLLAVCETRRPDALARLDQFEVRGGVAVKHVGVQFPVHKIARVVDRQARQPLECGHDNIAVIAFAADAGIRVEARQDRIVYHIFSFTGSINVRLTVQL